MADKFTYKVKEDIAVLSTNQKGWTREVRLISYNNRQPKLDIRDWPPDKRTMGKGISLNRAEATKLCEVLDHYLKGEAVGTEPEPEIVEPDESDLPF